MHETLSKPPILLLSLTLLLTSSEGGSCRLCGALSGPCAQVLIFLVNGQRNLEICQESQEWGWKGNVSRPSLETVQPWPVPRLQPAWGPWARGTRQISPRFLTHGSYQLRSSEMSGVVCYSTSCFSLSFLSNPLWPDAVVPGAPIATLPASKHDQSCQKKRKVSNWTALPAPGLCSSSPGRWPWSSESMAVMTLRNGISTGPRAAWFPRQVATVP